MKIKAYAKINLALDVVRKREDGYHDLEMIMAPIELHDLLYVDIIDEGIIIESNNKIMPTDKKNIMYQIANKIIERYNIEKGIKIFIYKHIPTQAGLAGGSSDGAAIIRAMNKLFHLNMTNKEMTEIGKEVGADIPFCIFEKMAYVEGIGEKLQFINTDFNCHILLVKPKSGVSTKRAFENLDLSKVEHKSCKEMKNALENNDYQVVIDNLQNTLETPAMNIVKDIAKIKEKLINFGFDGVLMSGSGSTVFGLTRDSDIINKAFKSLRNEKYFVKKTKIKE